MTVSDVNGTSSTEKILLRALIISLLLHVLVFSLWRVGLVQGWWTEMALPHWMQAVSKAMMPVVPKKPPLDRPSQTELTFVEIDPALATPEPPKKPMFQGAQNTLAANRGIKVLSAMPNIDGSQEKFLKTTENAKPKPLRPRALPRRLTRLAIWPWFVRRTKLRRAKVRRTWATNRSLSPSPSQSTTDLGLSARRRPEMGIMARRRTTTGASHTLTATLHWMSKARRWAIILTTW